MKTKGMIIAVVLIILALAGGFFAGMQYQKSQRLSFGSFAGGGAGFRMRFGSQGGQGGTMAFRPVRGQVLSISNSTITVKLTDGSSKIVVVSPQTQYMKETQASVSDIQTGNTITVIGSQNSDGSVTATNVQIGGVQPKPSPVPTQ